MRTHRYVTQNGKIVRESYLRTTLDYIYDESGRPFALIYTNAPAEPVIYYYVLNLQGDVVKLIEADGTVAAEYTYNAWGEILSSSGEMAVTNPLRYRGYYCDVETGFYYLKSRYYDPVTHRFINADGYASTGQDFIGTNMFAYCNNNPVLYLDSEGNLPTFCIAVSDGPGSEPGLSPHIRYVEYAKYETQGSGTIETTHYNYSYTTERLTIKSQVLISR